MSISEYCKCLVCENTYTIFGDNWTGICVNDFDIESSVCICRAGSLDTNRSNSLVVKLITQRYPEFCAVHYVSTLITNSGLPEKTRDDIQKIQSVPEVKKCLYLVCMFHTHRPYTILPLSS